MLALGKLLPATENQPNKKTKEKNSPNILSSYQSPPACHRRRPENWVRPSTGCSQAVIAQVYKLIDASMGFLARLCRCLPKKLRPGAGGGGGDEDGDGEGGGSSDLFFDLRTLQVATNFFSEANKLGHGGFGPVYKVEAW